MTVSNPAGFIKDPAVKDRHSQLNRQARWYLEGPCECDFVPAGAVCGGGLEACQLPPTSSLRDVWRHASPSGAAGPLCCPCGMSSFRSQRRGAQVWRTCAGTACLVCDQSRRWACSAPKGGLVARLRPLGTPAQAQPQRIPHRDGANGGDERNFGTCTTGARVRQEESIEFGTGAWARSCLRSGAPLWAHSLLGAECMHPSLWQNKCHTPATHTPDTHLGQAGHALEICTVGTHAAPTGFRFRSLVPMFMPTTDFAKLG